MLRPAALRNPVPPDRRIFKRHLGRLSHGPINNFVDDGVFDLCAESSI